MKKYIYLCGMMLMSLNMMAQQLIDKNYYCAFSDDFDETGRFWQNFKDSPNYLWRAFCGEFSSGVTRGTHEHQVYRCQNCIFEPAESAINLIGEYAGHQLQCGEYEIPYGYECDTNHHSLFYYSGNIETRQKFRYGYFEIKCKLPFHIGSYPAFWLWGASDTQNYYEEIDIMEYDYGPLIGNGSSTIYSTGCLNNTNGTAALPVYGKYIYLDINNDITDFHVYGCEWLPNRIIWYLDGNVVGEFSESGNIPCHQMTVKANYSIGNSSLYHPNLPDQYPLWVGSDVMTIDYIRVFQLRWDCSTDEVIAGQSDLDDFDYSVKKSLTIISDFDDVCIRTTDTANFRVADFFEIDGPFEVKTGGILSVFAHDCIEQ